MLKKGLDWLHEAEYRFLFFDKTEYLSIEGCIGHIVLGNRFFENKENEHKLIELLIKYKERLDAKNINPLSFTQVFPNGVGFSEHLIEYKLQEIASRYRDFQEYLNAWYNLRN